MRDRPITVAPMCGNILSRTQKRCAVKVEVRGFTSRSWQAGRSGERWVADGKRRNPGRLNELCTLFTTRPARRGGASARTSA